MKIIKIWLFAIFTTFRLSQNQYGSNLENPHRQKFRPLSKDTKKVIPGLNRFYSGLSQKEGGFFTLHSSLVARYSLQTYLLLSVTLCKPSLYFSNSTCYIWWPTRCYTVCSLLVVTLLVVSNLLVVKFFHRVNINANEN